MITASFPSTRSVPPSPSALNFRGLLTASLGHARPRSVTSLVHHFLTPEPRCPTSSRSRPPTTFEAIAAHEAKLVTPLLAYLTAQNKSRADCASWAPTPRSQSRPGSRRARSSWWETASRGAWARSRYLTSGIGIRWGHFYDYRVGAGSFPALSASPRRSDVLVNYGDFCGHPPRILLIYIPLNMRAWPKRRRVPFGLCAAWCAFMLLAPTYPTSGRSSYMNPRIPLPELPGAGLNETAEVYFIEANLYDYGAHLPHWTKQLVQLIKHLGLENTKEVLREFEGQLGRAGVRNRVVLDTDDRRGGAGCGMGTSACKEIWPYFSYDDETVDKLRREEPVEVATCWNGIAIFDADWFLPTLPGPPTIPRGEALRFRADTYCAESECFRLSYDMHLRTAPKRPRIDVNPQVNVAYTPHNWLYYGRLKHLSLTRPWRVVWEDWIAHRLFCAAAISRCTSPTLLLADKDEHGDRNGQRDTFRIECWCPLATTSEAHAATLPVLGGASGVSAGSECTRGSRCVHGQLRVRPQHVHRPYNTKTTTARGDITRPPQAPRKTASSKHHADTPHDSTPNNPTPSQKASDFLQIS
ncbi:hypothetical protein B0H16DRAFT_1747756 [Mycena metata]|uniref:Glycosyltransferase family 69 protein n=1 Tax=Mycena metata TaxID=1033252 RepID=A0AAD7GS82_9AGAR|nr:hypothetical protein B0H16DRAFT_1747756 [Mycena metata]